jgi:hypothetical protein
MKKDITYRFLILTNNVYNVSFAIQRSLTINPDKSTLSGFIKKSKLPELLAEVIEFGISFKDGNIKLMTADRYWKNWDKINS